MLYLENIKTCIDNYVYYITNYYKIKIKPDIVIDENEDNWILVVETKYIEMQPIVKNKNDFKKMKYTSNSL
jgi:hypothetical protein